MSTIADRLQDVLPTPVDMAAYADRGFFLSDVIIPGEVLDAAEHGMRRFYAGERDRPGPPGVEGIGWRPEHGGGLRKNDYASSRIDALADLVQQPAIAAIAARLSGAGVIRLWADQLLFKPVDVPGRPANVGWHTDRQYWTGCTSEDMLTAWVPFHDVDEASGSITFINGSHHWEAGGLDFFDHDRDSQEAALAASGHRLVKTPAILGRGQVSFHHCRTIHGSGPNHSAEPRRSLAIHLQTGDNRYQRHTLPDGTIARHRNDDLCRRRPDGTPDYTDPALFPRLWPPTAPAQRAGAD